MIRSDQLRDSLITEMVWLARNSLTPAMRTSKPKRASGIAPAQPARLPPSDVLTRIRGLIEQGQILPGSKLPPERALAAELGAGRPALREAIKVLNGLGVLESRRGSGTFVKTIEPVAELLPAMSDFGNTDFGMLDLLEVRKILEPRAAWLAATRASERQLMEIENARLQLEMYDRDWKMAARLNYELHAAIFRSAQNPVLLLHYTFLMSRILGGRVVKAHLEPDVESTRSGHKAIVEALLKRQSDAAERAMIDHLQSVGMEFIREASR